MRAFRLRVRRVLVLAAAITCIHTAPALACSRDLLPVGASASTPQAAMVEATLCVLSEIRMQNGLRPLRLDPRLTMAAYGHALEQIGSGGLSHASSGAGDVATRALAQGYAAGAEDFTFGEILGRAQGSRATPQSVAAAWLESPSHRRELLYPPYGDAGVMVLTSGNESVFVVDFGYSVARLQARPKKTRRSYVSGTPRMRPLRKASTKRR